MPGLLGMNHPVGAHSVRPHPKGICEASIGRPNSALWCTGAHCAPQHGFCGCEDDMSQSGFPCFFILFQHCFIIRRDQDDLRSWRVYVHILAFLLGLNESWWSYRRPFVLKYRSYFAEGKSFCIPPSLFVLSFSKQMTFHITP